MPSSADASREQLQAYLVSSLRARAWCGRLAGLLFLAGLLAWSYHPALSTLTGASAGILAGTGYYITGMRIAQWKHALRVLERNAPDPR